MTPSDEAFLKKLQDNTGVELVFWNEKISLEHARVLSDFLKTNRTLQKLTLKGNSLNNEGLKILAAGLKANQALRVLVLSCNFQVDDEGGVAIAEALEANATLVEIDLSFNRLSLWFGRAIAKVLKKNGPLKQLNLSNNALRDVGAHCIAEGLVTNTTLKILNVSANQFGDEGAEALAKALKKNKALTRLNLSYNKINHTGRNALLNTLQMNSSLEIRDEDGELVNMAARLAENKKFQENIHSVGTELYVQNGKISTDQTQWLTNFLEKSTTLQELNLNGNELDFEGVQILAAFLERNKTLQVIRLFDTGLNDAGVQILAKALEKNGTVKKLDLSLNRFGIVGCQGIIATLKINTTLEEIDLSHSYMEINIELINQITTLLTQNKITRAAAASSDVDKKKRQETKEEDIPLPASYVIDDNAITFGKRIGNVGSFGMVYQGTFFNGTYRFDDVAIKKSNDTKKASATIRTECALMQRFDDPHVVKFFGYCPKFHSLVMERMTIGSLFDLLHYRQQPLTPEQQEQIAIDMAYGLRFLHKNSILHRDFKSENVLLTGNHRAKLSDFGLSTLFAGNRKWMGWAGTKGWMAPEVSKDGCTEASDTYSYGITLWEMATYQIPNPNWSRDTIPIRELQKNIPSKFPRNLTSLIQVCCALEAQSRPSANEVVDFLQSKKEDFVSFLPAFRKLSVSVDAAAAAASTAVASVDPKNPTLDNSVLPTLERWDPPDFFPA